MEMYKKLLLKFANRFCALIFLVCFIGIAIDSLFGLSALQNHLQKKALVH